MRELRPHDCLIFQCVNGPRQHMGVGSCRSDEKGGYVSPPPSEEVKPLLLGEHLVRKNPFADLADRISGAKHPGCRWEPLGLCPVAEQFPRADGRDLIEIALRDAFAAGCNAARHNSLYCAMDYAAHHAPAIREALEKEKK